ncbi:MAG TPA: hypothetical protein PKA39_01690 [Ignavibacteria bacterium]|nr:hypothetical protein [Ignavibacteria bacterium]
MQIRTLQKILWILQIPIYILLLKFLLSFFVKVDGISESIDSIFSALLWIFAVSFMLSGVLSCFIVVYGFFKKNRLPLLILFLLASAALFVYIFKYSAHLMFIIIPAVVVLYHVVIFSTTAGRDGATD